MIAIQTERRPGLFRFAKKAEPLREEESAESAIRIRIRDVSEMPQDLVKALRAIYEESFRSEELGVNDDEE